MVFHTKEIPIKMEISTTFLREAEDSVSIFATI